MKNGIIQISAKNLGELTMPDFCPRCFWIKLNCKLPYQIFPGIFSSIDSYTKKITWAYYEKHGKLPDWFNEFGDFEKPIKVPSRNAFFIIDNANNIKLTGIPDEIVQKKDGSYFIIDYKTARFTGKQDELLPIYNAQLSVYALIAEHCGINPVTGIGLIYYEPMTDISTGDLKKLLIDDGFNMLFKAKLLPIELNPKKTILPLLAEIRKLADMNKPPKDNDECKDCAKLRTILSQLNN